MNENTISKNLKKHFYLSQESIDYIEEFRTENNLTKSKALEKIIQDHKANSYLEKEDFHKKIADKIYENFKNQVGKDINCARITDKNVQVLIEMFNFFLVNNAKESDTNITTDQFKSPMLIIAEKEIENRINRNHKKSKDTLA